MPETTSTRLEATHTVASAERVPATIWLIAGGIFAMVTSEFMAAGLLPNIADGVGVSIGAAALLISGFAAGQVVGPWLLGMPLSRFGPRLVLTGLLVAFAAAQVVGVLAPWSVMLSMRLVSGAMMSAYFSIALGTATRLVPGPAQPRATATIFAGVTIGTALGLPLATFAGRAVTWQWAFHIDTIAVLAAGAAIMIFVPSITGTPPLPLREMLQPLANRRLWLTLSTAGLSIGGTLLGFAFFPTILERVTGVDPSVVPWLLALYGLASVVGNWAVGRLTSSGPARVLTIGLIVLAAGLLAFWAAPTSLPIVIVAMIAIGVSGVSLNAAHAARTIAAGGQHPAIMSMLPTVVTGGILLGTSLGSIVVDSGLGLLAPLWMGALFATAGLLTLIPDALDKRRAATPDLVEVPMTETCSIG
jgi:predicted MFS family arabinose efflux permease